MKTTNAGAYLRESAKMSAMIPNPHSKRYANMVACKMHNDQKLPVWLQNEMPWWKAGQIEKIAERRLRNFLAMPGPTSRAEIAKIMRMIKE